MSHRVRIGFKLSFYDVAPVKATLERLVDFNEHYIKLSVEFMLNDKLLDFANCLTTNQTTVVPARCDATVVPARCDGWERTSRSIECGSDFVDHRLHVKIFRWHNAGSSTGFFNRAGNDWPDRGYSCTQKSLPQRLL